MEDWMTIDNIRNIDTPFNKLARPFFGGFIMKVLITGGIGGVGKALISQNDNEYISISRNEENIAKLKENILMSNVMLVI